MKGGEIIPLWWRNHCPCEKIGDIYSMGGEIIYNRTVLYSIL